MKKILVSFCVLAVLVMVPGCHWMGKTAGKAQTAIEESFDDAKQGYEEGHKKEESQPAPKEDAAPKQQEAASPVVQTV